VAELAAIPGPVLTMAKKAISSAAWACLCARASAFNEHFLNELYRLEDSQEGLRARWWKKRKPNWKESLNTHGAFSFAPFSVCSFQPCMTLLRLRHTLEFQFAGRGCGKAV